MISEWVGSDRVGSIIEGRFHLQRWLGGAGESGVFLTQIGGRAPRNAAIKIIPAGIADAESLLDQWIKAKHRIHPNLIQLFHAGYCSIDDCDLLYAVTDCADEILADVLRVRPLTPTEVREMLDPLLETLSWLHEQGLVYGCLKPSNVMVVNEQIKLSVDRIQPAGPRIFPVLSPGAHDAPEAAGKIAPAADVWSLGVLLVEALTQNPPPWDGTAYRIPAAVPQPFAAIASECLRLEPARRCTLRDIRSHLAPARALAPATLISPAPVSPEPARVAPAPPAAGFSSDPPTELSPDLLSIPSSIPSLVVPPHLAERVAALLEPASPVVKPAVPQAQPVFEALPTATPGAVPTVPETAPIAEDLPTNVPAEAPAKIAPEQLGSTPEQPALEAANDAPDEMPDRSPSAHPLAAAAQWRTSVPAAAPVRAAQKLAPNRRATMVASAMVVIASSLMLTIGLHRSNPPSLPGTRSSAKSEPPAPAKAIPLQQAAVPPASPARASVAPVPVPWTVTPGIPVGPTTHGAIIHRVLPAVTQRAMDTIRGRLVVIVRVQVDANGNVSDASYDYEGNSHYLKTAALAAARNWKFLPPQVGGRPVPSTWDLQFWFDQTGPSVIAIEKTS